MHNDQAVLDTDFSHKDRVLGDHESCNEGWSYRLSMKGYQLPGDLLETSPGSKDVCYFLPRAGGPLVRRAE